MLRLGILGGLIAAAMGCDVISGDACSRYVDYMCDCHPEENCSELETTLGDPDASLLDQCAIDLSDQKAEDAANGFICGGGGGDSESDTGIDTAASIP